LLAAILAGLFVVLFIQSFQPGQILFANDNTLGLMRALPNRLPSAFTGKWHSGGWVGIQGLAVAPTISAFLTMVLPPEIFLKVYAPFTMLFLGLCAWVFFRQLEFNPGVCVLGGIAAGLNMHFFSIACWGTGSWNIAAGMVFLALAALCSKAVPQVWEKGILAGLAVGLDLMEGYDVGAIMCIYVGIFILYQVFTWETTPVKRVFKVIGVEALVVLFSALLASYSIFSLVGTQVVGVVGTGQDVQTKEQRWNPATQWSLPKLETLRVVSPGLFGYRMAGRINVPDKSSSYWGQVGRDTRLAVLAGENSAERTKAIDAYNLPQEIKENLQSNDPQTRENALQAVKKRSSTITRYSGSGEYAGMLVSILAIFASVNALRGSKSPFSVIERRYVWFWIAAAIVSLMASWGRHFVFYRLIYDLPYVSTIRNPIKFMHPFHIAWIILAGYGLEALWRRYLRSAPAWSPALTSKSQPWWPKAPDFEKKWAVATIAIAALSIIGCIVYYNWEPHLIAYLEEDGFTPGRALQVAGYSVGEAAWTAGWLIFSAAAVLIIMSGAWSGAKSRKAWICLGIILILDLVRSDVPWIHYFNYAKEYTANTVVDFLSDKPYEHRVTGRLSPKGLGSGIGTQLGMLYDYWQQNEFPYYKIQCLDFAQWPRVPEQDAAYMKNFALQGNDLVHADLWPSERLWELTNTKYVLTASVFEPRLNDSADPRHSFAVKSFLRVMQKPDVTQIEDVGDMTVVPEQSGTYALLEFSNALPRAKLFSNWQVPENGEEALKTLASRQFNPEETVLVARETPAGQPPANPKADPGTVTITDYEPKDITLQATAAVPAVLLLNERTSPTWRVYVDDKPAELLRCNYLMRGVYLTQGAHHVEFRYQPSLAPLYLSVCAWTFGILTAGYLMYSKTPARTTAPIATAPAPQPIPVAPTPVSEQKPASAPAGQTQPARPKNRRRR
jgi:hypothetical protein